MTSFANPLTRSASYLIVRSIRIIIYLGLRLWPPPRNHAINNAPKLFQAKSMPRRKSHPALAKTGHLLRLPEADKLCFFACIPPPLC